MNLWVESTNLCVCVEEVVFLFVCLFFASSLKEIFTHLVSLSFFTKAFSEGGPAVMTKSEKGCRQEARFNQMPCWREPICYFCLYGFCLDRFLLGKKKKKSKSMIHLLWAAGPSGWRSPARNYSNQDVISQWTLFNQLDEWVISVKKIDLDRCCPNLSAAVLWWIRQCITPPPKKKVPVLDESLWKQWFTSGRVEVTVLD